MFFRKVLFLLIEIKIDVFAPPCYILFTYIYIYFFSFRKNYTVFFAGEIFLCGCVVLHLFVQEGLARKLCCASFKKTLTCTVQVMCFLVSPRTLSKPRCLSYSVRILRWCSWLLVIERLIRSLKFTIPRYFSVTSNGHFL